MTETPGPVNDQAAPSRRPPLVSVVSTSTSTALRVDYDGTRPPLELFFVWTSLGWRAPAPAGPPKDAIDWATPDPTKGTSYTIRPFPATGTATLDAASTRDSDAMVRSALDAAVRLGCIVDRPEPIDEIDLRDATLRADHPSSSARTAAADVASSEPPQPRALRGRRARGGALARVRGIVPTIRLTEVERAARDIEARLSHEDEPTPEDHPDGPRVRVTLEVPAAAADSAMRALTSVSTGTPTIEIVTARDLAHRRR